MIARRFELTPQRLATFARVVRRLKRSTTGLALPTAVALFAAPSVSLLLAIASATFLAIRGNVAFALVAVLLAFFFIVLWVALIRGMRRRPTMPCTTGIASIDDTGVAWRFDDGAEIELDWPGIVAWADDGHDAIYLLDAVGTGHVVPLDGDGDVILAAFNARCPEARRVLVETGRDKPFRASPP